MSYNGVGVFRRLYNFVQDAANGIPAKASRFDDELDGIATALSNVMTRDGQAAMTKALPMGGQKITGLGDATAADHALSQGFADTRYPTKPTLLSGLGAAMVGIVQAGAGAVTRLLQDKARETISPRDFGAIGDDTLHTVAEWIIPGALGRYNSLAALQADYPHVAATTDSIDWAAWQAAINYATTNAARIRDPGGKYHTNKPLTATAEFTLSGAGMRKTIITLHASASTDFAFSINLPDNSSVIGLDWSGLRINCDGTATFGGGVYLRTTANNSAFSQCHFSKLYIRNCSRGFDMDGVIYKSTWHKITITGTVKEYGFYCPNSIFGQFIYNGFSDIEVTGVGDNAWAYWLNAADTTFFNLTADGVALFDGAGSKIHGYAIEGIVATTVPAAATAAIMIYNLAGASDVQIINVPNAKIGAAIDLFGSRISLEDVRVPDSGPGNQPNVLLNLHAGQSGVIKNVQCDRADTAKIDNYTPAITLAGYVFIGCDGITNANFRSAYVPWTGYGFSGWTTNPTVNAASYSINGRMVTVMMNLYGGVAGANAQVTGLPYSCDAQGVGVAIGVNAKDTSDPTAPTAEGLRYTALIFPGNALIQSIPARNFTGVYHQLVATYPLAAA